MKYTYLLIDLFTVVVPLIFSFHPRIRFAGTWKAFFLSVLPVAAIFIAWDAAFVSLGVWSFNRSAITGIFVFNLPIEENLFFICVPFSCVFTYFCLNRFFDLSWGKKAETVFCICFSLVLLITGIVFRERWYTAVTMISTALLCPFLLFVVRIDWFGRAITSYALLLIPFMIINGLLTGTVLKEPVVRYNSLDNLNIRVLTIPVEDFIYGWELILLNIFLYNFFRLKFNLMEDKYKRQA